MKAALFFLGLAAGIGIGFLFAGSWDAQVEQPDYGPPLEPDGDDSNAAGQPRVDRQ